MRVLFVLDMSMLREYEGDDNAGVVAVHEYVAGTRGSDILCSVDDVLGMSVVRGMRGIGGVCEMCMCLARGGV